MPQLSFLNTSDIFRSMEDGRLSCVELMRAYLNEIELHESEIKAWAHLDKDRAISAAQDADAIEKSKRGPLHGLPVGVKDLFDTVDFPTEYGCRFWKGHRAENDAVAVELLRRAGAIIIGKTVTTECGLLHPGPTRNPRNLLHTPGGSSSGSAAAVAAHMAALTLGSQTNASTIRPASYCGVYGFKASFGLISRVGLARIAPALDTVGVFSRDLLMLARTLDVLAGNDLEDSCNQGHMPARFEKALSKECTRSWRVGFVRTPVWERVEPYLQSLIENFVKGLARHVTVVNIDLPPSFRRAHQEHLVIQDVSVANLHYESFIKMPEGFSAETIEMILRGHGLPSSRVDEALEWQRRMAGEMDERLSHVDVAVTAAATGEAPATLENTGDSAMSTIWSLTGVPALSVPQFTGEQGLPIGLQVVARRNHDADVLSFAAFLKALGL